MEFLNSLLYFIIVIGVLVLIHEFGHFIAAKMSGMRVDIFSIGMGPRLLGWNKQTGFKFGSLPNEWTSEGYTDYRLSLLPLGGYVKIAGMVDESFDTDYAGQIPQPWEFRSKNTIQKFFTLSAGVIMNALLAVFLFSVIFGVEGASIYPSTTIGYIQKSSLAEKSGLVAGDKIVSINNTPVNNWNDVIEKLTLSDFGSNKNLVVNHQGETKYITIPGDQVVKAIANEKFLGLYSENSRVYILDAETLRPAGKLGLKSGDTVLAVNNEPITSTAQLIDMMKANTQNSVFFQWKHQSQILADSVKPDKDGTIGIAITDIYIGPIIHKTYGMMESTELGIKETITSVKLFIGSLVQIFEGNISVKQSLGGPIMIAKKASQTAGMGIISFLHFMGLLSITLAVINILPFPALDGGHLVFVVIEGIIRREISVKVKLAFQKVGFVVLMALMAFVVYNDIIRLLF
jgi:regulator of sigma E protease